MRAHIEHGWMSLSHVAGLIGVPVPPQADPDLLIKGGASLETAEPWHVAYMEGTRQSESLRTTRAGACLVREHDVSLVPPGTVALVVASPRSAYARLLAALYPDALRPAPLLATDGIDPSCLIHPTAVIEPGVVMDPGVIVGARAVICAGTTIGAHTAIGPNVIVGHDGAISAGVSLTHCRIGDRVILHSGVRIGQDGFGFVSDTDGHRKFPQIGGVIIADDVEIGANTTIDRGSGRDTFIGHGTKIDNLVQIGHNVQIGRHCIIVAQVGIAGSTILEDNVVVGGQAAISDHLHIGRGARIAGASGVMRDIPAEQSWGGYPARPTRQWFREHAVLARIGRRQEAHAGDAPGIESSRAAWPRMLRKCFRFM